MSLSSTLSIALRSMLADQGAMNVVSNNIANANTPGYSREEAVFQETSPVEYGNLSYGTGVTLSDIKGIRDAVLQMRLNQETQNQGKLDAETSGLNQIQTLFNEASGTGLQSLLSQFFNGFQELAADPTNSGLRQSVIGDAQNLAAGFRQTANSLTTQQQNVDQSIQQTVGEINQITAQIATLNGQISTSTGSGLNANAFVDQRSQLINQLSQYVDVQSITADDGTLTLTTNGGNVLVVGNQSFNLQTQTNSTTGLQDIYAQGKDVTSTIQSGSLAGDLQLRDQEIPSLLTKLDTLANGVATAVNNQNVNGFDLNGNKGGNIFSPLATVAGSATNLTVAITDPNLIAASADGTSGNGDNATALADLQNNNITLLNSQTPMNYYSGIVFQVGNDASSASDQLSGEKLLVQQLQDQVNSVSGVSINEEAANLVLYQNAYNAAARVASVVAGLFQTAINMVST